MLPGLNGFSGSPALRKRAHRHIRLSPVPGFAYSAASLAFMGRARFESPRQAIYGMKDPNIPFLIQHVPS
jgi:hypothetical protein